MVFVDHNKNIRFLTSADFCKKNFIAKKIKEDVFLNVSYEKDYELHYFFSSHLRDLIISCKEGIYVLQDKSYFIFYLNLFWLNIFSVNISFLILIRLYKSFLFDQLENLLKNSFSIILAWLL